MRQLFRVLGVDGRKGWLK